MTISIITVCYNSVDTIEDTIKSVISQTVFDKIEYIIIDGASDDGTLDILNKYKKYFKLISQKDDGIYDAMNKGIELSNGETIGFINSDDFYIDNSIIENILNKFKSNNILEGIYCDLFYVSRKNTNKVLRYWKTGSFINNSFKNGWHPAHPTLFLKKEVYMKYGLFDMDYLLAADFEIMLRFIEKFKINIEYYRKPIVKMRIGGATSKSLKNIIMQNIEIIKAFKKNEIITNPFFYFLRRMKSKLTQYLLK
jgi:glycosyltransferase involved in cell wall biosynthesis|tara:strand:- start:28 stop:783 length:756 start_codon:yes stop_codon:yes gene_type:complete